MLMCINSSIATQCPSSLHSFLVLYLCVAQIRSDRNCHCSLLYRPLRILFCSACLISSALRFLSGYSKLGCIALIIWDVVILTGFTIIWWLFVYMWEFWSAYSLDHYGPKVLFETVCGLLDILWLCYITQQSITFKIHLPVQKALSGLTLINMLSVYNPTRPPRSSAADLFPE